MTENTNQNITVFIAGNPDGNAGEVILLNINNSPFKSEGFEKKTFDYITSDYYIELKHSAEYISYTYVMNPMKVHSQDSSRPGVFWIGVTIPKEKQIGNPYDLIIELRDEFQESYMTKRTDGSYEFKNVNGYELGVFKNILSKDKYKLIDLQSSYVQMTGTKNQVLSLNSDDDVVNDSAETKIRKFLDDTQYKEFKDCSSVIVAENIEGVAATSIEVPRLIKYTVRYGSDVLSNSKNEGEFNSKKNDFECTLKKDNHKDINVKFSLGDFVSNELLKEDNGSKYKVKKDKETFTIEVDAWAPIEKQIGIIIKYKGKEVTKEYIGSIKLKVKDNAEEINFEKDLGYYITLKGEEIGNYKKENVKVNKNQKEDVFDYILNDVLDNIIEIEVVEFNEIILSGVPCDEKDKKLGLEINDKEKPVWIEIYTTHNGGMYNIKIADHDVLKNITQFDIKSYIYVSEESYTDKCKIEPKQYDDTKGVLRINLEGFKKVSDNKQTDGNIPNQQTGSDEPTADDKCTFTVYNEIEESTIILNELCDNDKENILKDNSLKIENTKCVNGNKPQNYKEIENIDKLKEFSIKFKLKKNEGGNVKVKDNVVAVIVIENQDIEVHIKFKNDLTEDDKKAQVRYAIQNKDTKEFEVTIEEANNKDNKNNILAKFKDILSKILKRKDDESENSKPEVESAKTEDAANVDKHKNSKLRIVFKFLLFWLISVIIAFVFGLIVENKHDVFPLRNVFRGKTDLENFNNKVEQYLEMLNTCGTNLTFAMVVDIKKYCDSINNPKDSRNKYKTEEHQFNALNEHIKVFSDVASNIKNKTFAALCDIVPDSVFYQKLKENIDPLLLCSDTPNKKYETFVFLINEGITITYIESFAEVLELYKNSEEAINKKIESDRLLAEKKRLEDTCNDYYKLMEACSDKFTFVMVDEIDKWCYQNKDDTLINGYKKFKTIKEYIPHYKAAADAIRGIKGKIAKECLYFIDYMELDEIDILNTTRWNALKGSDFAKEMRKSCQIMTASAQYNKDKIIYTDAEYELFINLILADKEYDGLYKIDFNDVNSFYDVNKLYDDNRERIKNHNDGQAN